MLGRGEEFEVSLLVDFSSGRRRTRGTRVVTDLLIHVAIPRSPTVLLVLTLLSVDSRLRVDRQPSELVQLGETLADRLCLLCCRLVGPGERFDLTATESSEERGDVVDGERESPDGRGVGCSMRERERERVEITVGRRSLQSKVRIFFVTKGEWENVQNRPIVRLETRPSPTSARDTIAVDSTRK